MLTFLYLSITTENVSVTSKALVGDKGFTLCSILFQKLALKLFSTVTSGFVNEIVAITQNPKRFVMFTFTTPRNVSELTYCIAKNVRAFRTIFCSFYGEKEVLTERSDVE